MSEVPQIPAMIDFKDLTLSAFIFEQLDKQSIQSPTPIQQKVIPQAINAKDIIAVAQTGSGKTLAFLLPILLKFQKNPQSRALVLVPSREMASQILKVFESFNENNSYTTSLVIGGLPGNKQDKELRKNARFIVATPGRLNDLLENNKLLLQKVDTIVIDEADRMLDLGFSPQLKDIQKTMRGTWQTLMFSASFHPEVEKMAKIFMQNEITMIRTSDAEAPVTSLNQKVIYLKSTQKNHTLLEEIKMAEGSIMVFAGSGESCEKIFDHLKEHKVSCDYIHGALTQGNRSRIVNSFRENKIRVLVCSDLLARGLDVPHVGCVINFDMPYESEDFLHRIGRTARAGRSGTAVTFVTPQDLKMYKQIQIYLKDAKEITLS